MKKPVTQAAIQPTSHSAANEISTQTANQIRQPPHPTPFSGFCATTHLYVDDEKEWRVGPRLDERHPVSHPPVSADVVHTEQVMPAVWFEFGLVWSGWSGYCRFGLVWFGSVLFGLCLVQWGCGLSLFFFRFRFFFLVYVSEWRGGAEPGGGERGQWLAAQEEK